MVILDTNIIIDHLRASSGSPSTLMRVVIQEGKDSLGISAITVQELFEGQSTKDERKLEQLLSILSPLKIFEYNLAIAQLAGEIARDLKDPIEFADASIAATCIHFKCELLTLNKKHFNKIPDLELFTKFTN